MASCAEAQERARRIGADTAETFLYRPIEIRSGEWPGAWRVRVGRCSRWLTGSSADVERLRSGTHSGCAEEAPDRRNSRARGEHAEPRDLCAPGPGISRRRFAKGR